MVVFYAKSTSAVLNGEVQSGSEPCGGPVVLLPLHRSAAQGRKAVKQALGFDSFTGQRAEGFYHWHCVSFSACWVVVVFP